MTLLQKVYKRSISCSASTIDSIDSRRPSDPVRVPETLEEADSLNYDNTSREGVPSWANHPTRQQWHRDRWLSDQRNSKHYSDKSTDIDSGTEMHHISESECEDCLGLLQQDSITSSCSAGARLTGRRASYSVTTQTGLSYDCDSQSECSSLTQYYRKPVGRLSLVENNNLTNHTPADNHSRLAEAKTQFHADEVIPLATPSSNT